MNSVHLIGRLTKDIELRYTASGTAVGSFTLAVNRRFPNQQGEREADFINCVIWQKPAETLANYTRKGSQIAVEGRIQVRHYENQQGQRVYVTEVVVNNFDFLESKSTTEQRPVGQSQPQYGGSQIPQTPSYDQQPVFQPQNTFQNDFASGPFMDEGRLIDVSEDDLPF